MGNIAPYICYCCYCCLGDPEDSGSIINSLGDPDDNYTDLGDEQYPSVRNFPNDEPGLKNRGFVPLDEFLLNHGEPNKLQRPELERITPRQPSEQLIISSDIPPLSARLEYPHITAFATKINNQEYIWLCIPFPYVGVTTPITVPNAVPPLPPSPQFTE